MENFISMDINGTVQEWEEAPKYEKGEFIRGEQPHRGTYVEKEPDWLKPGQVWQKVRPGLEFKDKDKKWNGWWWRLDQDNSRRLVSKSFEDNTLQSNLNDYRMEVHLCERDLQSAKSKRNRAFQVNPVHSMRSLYYSVSNIIMNSVTVERDPDTQGRWTLKVQGTYQNDNGVETHTVSGEVVFIAGDELNLESYEGDEELVLPLVSELGYPHAVRREGKPVAEIKE